MKAAKFTRSDDISASVPVEPPLSLSILVASSGDAVVNAARNRGAFVAECFVRYALLHVIGFSGKDHQGLVLRLPAKAGDGAIVAAHVEAAVDAQLRLDSAIGRKIRLQSRVRSCFHETKPKHRSRNAEDHIVSGKLLSEVRLSQRASFSVSFDP